jgi:hypothetical protein
LNLVLRLLWDVRPAGDWTTTAVDVRGSRHAARTWGTTFQKGKPFLATQIIRDLMRAAPEARID